jgi:hypothetical protein
MGIAFSRPFGRFKSRTLREGSGKVKSNECGNEAQDHE